MWVPEVQKAFKALGDGKRECVVVGIESHICVTQTTLDLLKEGHKVYVIADGVSSCNAQEVPIALARLRAEGAVRYGHNLTALMTFADLLSSDYHDKRIVTL